MVPWRATEDGFVTQENLDWYRRFAAGRPGVLVVEATGVRDIPSGPLLRIGHDRFIPGLKQLVDVVSEASEGQTKLFIQIIDFLSVKRRPEKEKYFARFLHLMIVIERRSRRLLKIQRGWTLRRRKYESSLIMRPMEWLITCWTRVSWNRFGLVIANT